MDYCGVLGMAWWVFYSPVFRSDKQCEGILSLSCRDSRGGPGIPSFVLVSDDCKDYELDFMNSELRNNLGLAAGSP